MNNKKVDQKEREREIKRRKELEQMIQQTTTDLEIATREASMVLPSTASLSLDYHVVKNSIDRESVEIVSSIAEFYLDKEIISEVPYVKQKVKVDEITVSSLLFQMRTAEHAIIKLLSEIDNGNLQPRTFEVLASLQRSKMEIIKHLTQFMVIIENAYKNFQSDYRIKKAETVDVEGEEIDDDGIRTRGTRQLLKTIHKIRRDMDGDDPGIDFENGLDNDDGEV